MKSIARLWAVGLFAVLFQGQAIAQSAIEEIVVTATRRESSAQDTAIAMSIYTPDSIAENGVYDIGSLVKFDPHVQFTGSGEGFITIRGITSTDTTESGDPAVPVAFDEFYTNRPLSHFGTLYDIERVEVLRGPQGTLYGRNAVGGIINVYTAKPVQEFEAGGSLEIGNYNTLNLTGMLNAPLSDRVAIRVSGTSVAHDGYRKLEPVGLEGDDANTRSARFQLAASPTDSFSVRFLVQATRIGGVGPAVESLNFTYFNADGTPGSPDCVLAGCSPDHITPVGAQDDSGTFQAQLGNTLDIDELSARLRLSYELSGGAMLEYLGGYSDLDWLARVEVSRKDGSVTPRAPLPGPDWFKQHETPETWNHELRYVSPSDRPFTWQAGLFYFEETSSLRSERIDRPRSPDEFSWLVFDYPDLMAESKAAYVQGEFSLSDSLHLSVGARYTDDTKSRAGRVIVFANPNAVVAPAGSMNNDEATWHIGLDWNLSDETMLYGKADKGYKAGGYTNTAQYGPEVLNAYEIGFKTTLNDRVQLSAAAFYNDYEDQQVAQLGQDVTAGTMVFNAGKSEIAGLELDMDALLGQNGRLGFHASLLDGEYKDFALTNGSNTCPDTNNEPPACNIQLAGNDPIQTPGVSLSADIEYTFDNFMGGALTPRALVRYRGESYLSPFNYDMSKVDPYTIADLNAEYVPDGANWSVNLYVRNLTDEVFFTSAGEAQVSGIETYNYAYSAPRTFGVRFDFDWE